MLEMARSRKALPQQRYGIAEWFGRDILTISQEEREELAASASTRRPTQHCPYQTQYWGENVWCGKAGGVCSIRQYERAADGSGKSLGGQTAICPFRFYEEGTAVRDVARMVLEATNFSVAGEVEFLRSRVNNEYVGSIDAVLYDTANTKNWCALELQAVYFSGNKMSLEFPPLALSKTVPFPTGDRHPDFRSSGPKRLMPQLQTKVPTLRRWGKRMAVVVDQEFVRYLGTPTRLQEDLSLCDLVWFIVGYQPGQPFRILNRYMTTLEDAVEWLTGGIPDTQRSFEARLGTRKAHQIKPVLHSEPQGPISTEDSADSPRV
jgi:hypothetical protein